MVNREAADRRAHNRAIICENALAIYIDLQQQTPGNCKGKALGEAFKGSWNWFEKFKKRTSIQLLFRHGVARIIVIEGYISQQIFNCDGAKHFGKKMPS